MSNIILCTSSCNIILVEDLNDQKRSQLQSNTIFLTLDPDVMTASPIDIKSERPVHNNSKSEVGPYCAPSHSFHSTRRKESRGMARRNTETTRHGPSKASTGGWCRSSLLIAVLVFTLTIRQLHFHTLVDDAIRQLSESRVQGFLPPVPVDFSEGSTDDTTSTVAQLNERPFTAVNSTLIEKRQVAKYAYAFVIGGCNPDEESPTYRYFVYNILVSTRVLRESGSQADVVAFFQISYKSTYDRLPSEDVRMLEAMNVRIKYIPKSPHESFYRTVLDKFRILGLVEYRRVLLMDGDVMPNTSLDYLFEMSDGENATLMENLVVAGKIEPANAGFFMVAPKPGDLEQINGIIQGQEVKAESLPYPYFDPVEGWGHVIQPGDQWEALNDQGTNWTFWSAFSDQGLLYYWTKYVKKSVSIVRRADIQNWGTGPYGMLQLEETLVDPFRNHSLPPTLWKRMASQKRPPNSDYYHFTGRGKPWYKDPPVNFSKKWRSANHFWFYHLSELNGELQMGLNFQNWTKNRRSALGMNAMFSTIHNASTNLLEVY